MVFEDGFVDDVSELDEGGLLHELTESTIILSKFMLQPINKIVNLGVLDKPRYKNLRVPRLRQRYRASHRRIITVEFGLSDPLSRVLGPSKSGSLTPEFQLISRLFAPIEPSKADEVERVRQQIRFNLHIQGRISRQRWTQINFQNPRLEIRVDQDIEAEHFKTVQAEHVVLPHRLEYVILATG